MNQKNIIKAVLLLAAGLLLASCKSDDPVKERQKAIEKLYKDGSVKIAVTNSFDQNLSKMWEGALLAQEKINKSGKLPVKLELVKFNDGGDTVKGMMTAYEIASNDDICAVIGHGYSDLSLSCSLIYQYYGLLTFNYISTIHTLTERNNPLIFSNMPNDTKFGEEISKICEEKGYSSVIIYYLENSAGTSLSNAFEINCSKRGITIVNRDSYDSTAASFEFERTIKRWKNNFMFDAVFLAGRMPEIPEIISILRKNGINCPVLGADPFDDPLLTEQLGPEENGRIFAVSNYDAESKHPAFKEFYSDFEKKYGEAPDQEALQAYDAVMVLAGAIEKAGGANPTEIAQILRQQKWAEAAGPYSFDKNGALQKRGLTQKVFTDGQFVKIHH